FVLSSTATTPLSTLSLHDALPIWPDVSDAGLIAARETWLWPLLDEVQSLESIPDAALEQGLRALVPWDRQRALDDLAPARLQTRSEEHTSELQSRENLVCRLLLEK